MKNYLFTFLFSSFLVVGCVSRTPQEPAAPPLEAPALEPAEKQAAPPEPKEAFQHEYGDEKKPWTDKPFQNDPDEFQFAIVSDRTGGARRGVFPKAMKKLNRLHPEFVMSVGDLIEGYIEKKEAIESEWLQFDSFLKPLEMPFFYVAGNHDIFDHQSSDIWKKRFGRHHYAFLYKNVLFLCLNSQDDETHFLRGGLSAEQVKWATDILAQHKKVRWTYVFVHQPLWLSEERGNQYEKPHATGFGEIEKTLGERPYTVFAGHHHRYTKYQRHQHNYYVLGTTGGGSGLRGPEHGEFDHGVWVTMTKKGPKIANLTLEGIQTDSVYTEKMMKFEEALVFSKNDVAQGTELQLRFKNPFSHGLSYNLGWKNPPESGWAILPSVAEGEVAPGESHSVRVRLQAGKNQFPMPQAQIQFQAGDQYSTELQLKSSSLLFSYQRTSLTASRTWKSPVVDGKLDEKIWQRAAHDTNFRHYQSLELESGKTKVWTYYDSKNLYFAFDCSEPTMQKIRLTSEKRDHLQWQDNGVEILIRPDLAAKDYYQIILNAEGSVLDGKGQDIKHNMKFTAKTRSSENGWSAELAIPWTELGTPALRRGKELGLLLVRNRPSTDGILQFPPMNSGNHNPERFGTLKLF